VSAPDRERAFWRRVETPLIVLVALHSFGVGIGALLFAGPGTRFGGFGEVTPHFFVRQVGIFHVVVAFTYLWDWFRHRSVGLLLVTKTIAVLFLGTMMAVDRLPWVVPFSLVADGLMAVAVWAVHRMAGGTPFGRA
jgi:hypothetical protein